MASYPAGLKYTKDHEWIELSADRGKVGIEPPRVSGIEIVPGRGLDCFRVPSPAHRHSRDPEQRDRPHRSAA